MHMICHHVLFCMVQISGNYLFAEFQNAPAMFPITEKIEIKFDVLHTKWSSFPSVVTHLWTVLTYMT